MNIDERLAFLLQSTGSLHAGTQELHATVSKLSEQIAEHSEQIAEHTKQLQIDSENIRSLANLAAATDRPNPYSA